MSMTPVQIRTKDGIAPAHFFPPATGHAPGVILYMDAFGLRPTLDGMAERIAGTGYGVLVPDLYYRAGSVGPFDPKNAFADPVERERLTPLYKSLTIATMMEDTASFLDFLGNEPSTAGRKVGCVGYCMGGAFAIAATGRFPTRVGAGASFHGGRLATDQPDSPHLLAPKIRGDIYVGIAGIDPHFTDEERGRIRGALEACSVRHKIEIYEGVKHGFTVPDHPAYDRAAAERHYAALADLFARNLS